MKAFDNIRTRCSNNYIMNELCSGLYVILIVYIGMNKMRIYFNREICESKDKSCYKQLRYVKGHMTT